MQGAGGGSGTVPAKTPTVDEALDAKTALIYSPKAPLAGLFSPKGPSPPADPDQVRKDDRAVWAFVQAGFDLNKPEVLIYLHGHNYYVTAVRTAGTGVAARVPDWITGSDAGTARNKGVAQGPAGHFYQFDVLASSLPHKPLILLPEDGHHTHDPKIDKDTKQPIPGSFDGFWCKESTVGTLTTRGGLGDAIANCLERLSVLPVVPATGANYLTKKLALTDLKRLYLTAHSGGGVPLNASIVSDLAITTPTTACFLDATYGDYRANIRKYCETWQGKSLLGNSAGSSCLVIVFNPDSGTEKHKTEIVKDLRDPKKTVFTVTEVNHNGPADLPAVETALKSNSIVVIKTKTPHEQIPPTFVPLLLKNP
jgi:hypothetical protein